MENLSPSSPARRTALLAGLFATAAILNASVHWERASVLSAQVSSPTSTVIQQPQCADRIDNDGDGAVDFTAAPAADTVGLYDRQRATFYLKHKNETGNADLTFRFGTANSQWTTFAGDWNKDGVDTVGLFIGSASTFYLKTKNGSDSTMQRLTLTPTQNRSGWYAVAGDWNNDGTDTVGVYDPKTSTFYLKNKNETGGADVTFGYGTPKAGWLPVAGDWDNDGTDTIGLYDPKTSTFYLKNKNETGNADIAFGYGAPKAGWLPVAGDWDNDGTDTIGLFDPKTNTFYLKNKNTTGGADITFAYGIANRGWLPVMGRWKTIPADPQCSSPSDPSEGPDLCGNGILETNEECERGHPCASGFTCNSANCQCVAVLSSSSSTPSCAGEGQTVYQSAQFGPTVCCSKNAGIKPSARAGSDGLCIAPLNGSLGTCVDGWWQTCSNGLCEKGEDYCNCSKDCPRMSSSRSSISQCTDSDGGRDYYAFGHTQGISPSTGQQYEGEDLCGSATNPYAGEGYLVEHYCDGQYHTNEVIRCPNGCQNGACLRSSSSSWMSSAYSSATSSQASTALTVRGRLLETGTGLPVSGEQLGSLTPFSPAPVVTDNNGAYAFTVDPSQTSAQAVTVYFDKNCYGRVYMGIYDGPGRSEISVDVSITGGDNIRFSRTFSKQMRDIDLGDLNIVSTACSSSSSSAPMCGNGIKEGNESCDDRNTASGDCCSSTCSVEPNCFCTGQPSICTRCGNGRMESGESCDDGNGVPGDGCSIMCSVESGWVCMGSPSVCQRTSSSSSSSPYCGNGRLEAGEECERGISCPQPNCVGCPTYVCDESICTCELVMSSSSSAPRLCGNGIVDGGEQCDDGNVNNGDGCSWQCTLEDVSFLPQDACLKVPTLYWDQETNRCTSQHLICSDPDRGRTASQQAHTYGFRGQSSGPQDARIRTGGKDACIDATTLVEHFCKDTYFIVSEYINCPGGCSNGVCIGGSSSTSSAWSSSYPSSGSSSSPSAERGRLTIAQKALASADSAVENQKDINLLRFEARADLQDVLFTGATFTAQQGSLYNVSNYTLWVDTNGDYTVDTILEHTNVESNTVTFDNLPAGGFLMPRDRTVAYEVHGDVVSSLTSPDLLLAFKTSDGDYIRAKQRTDGSALSGITTNGIGTCTITRGCEINVTTTNSTAWTFRSQGDLYVTKDAVIGPRQLLGGTLGEMILKLKFHAEYEDIDVTDLVLNSSGSMAGSVDSLELFLDGGMTPIARSGSCGSADVLTVNNGSSTTQTQAFCFAMDNKQLVVPRGADVKVNVKPRMKSDVNGAVSVETIALFIDHTAAANDATGTGSVRARGIFSSNNLAANDGDTTAEGEIFIGRSSANSTNFRVTGSFNQTVLSKFTSITNGGAATGVVPNGVNDIGAFTFAAAPNNNSKDGLNKIFIADLILTVQATNVEMSGDGFRLYNKAVGSATSVTCSPYSTSGVALSGTVSGTFHLWCPDLEYGIIDSSVDSGNSDTFVLLANVTNSNTAAAQGGESILQVSLYDFTNPTKIGVAPTRSHIEWRDMDAASSQIFYWVEYPDTVVNSTTYHG